MQDDGFEYWFLASAVFTAMLYMTPFVLFIMGLTATFYYAALLLFLGFGLRPLLVKSGIHQYYLGVKGNLSDRLNRKKVAQRGREIDQKVRDDRYRGARRKDPKLPRNW